MDMTSESPGPFRNTTMFQQIVSNLSYSHHAVSQLSYYSRRLRREGVTRRLSAIFGILALSFQFAVTLVPPTSSNASSSADIIFGGLDSGSPKEDLLRIYDANRDSYGHKGFRELFTYFGISRQNLADAKQSSVDFDDKSIFYLGRNQHDSRDKKITVAGYTYYLRHPYNWDGRTRKVLAGKRLDGSYFAVAIDCGNIIVRTTYKPPAPLPQLTQPSPTPFPQPAPAPTPAPSPAPKASPTPAPAPPPAITSGTAELLLSKTAINLTQASIDASKQPAKAGDRIEYRLTAKNIGSAAEPDYAAVENINDILEYATVIDKGGATFDTSAGTLTWTKESLAVQASSIKTFMVEIKNPIPVTPRSSSDVDSYDLVMDNVYGNVVRIALQSPAPKQVEMTTLAVAQTLPETGAGTNLAIMLFVITLVVYFYARNRQLAKEVQLLRMEYN